jgi:hypothetical protein
MKIGVAVCVRLCRISLYVVLCCVVLCCVVLCCVNVSNIYISHFFLLFVISFLTFTPQQQELNEIAYTTDAHTQWADLPLSQMKKIPKYRIFTDTPNISEIIDQLTGFSCPICSLDGGEESASVSVSEGGSGGGVGEGEEEVMSGKIMSENVREKNLKFSRLHDLKDHLQKEHQLFHWFVLFFFFFFFLLFFLTFFIFIFLFLF